MDAGPYCEVDRDGHGWLRPSATPLGQGRCGAAAAGAAARDDDGRRPGQHRGPARRGRQRDRGRGGRCRGEPDRVRRHPPPEPRPGGDGHHEPPAVRRGPGALRRPARRPGRPAGLREPPRRAVPADLPALRRRLGAPADQRSGRGEPAADAGRPVGRLRRGPARRDRWDPARPVAGSHRRHRPHPADRHPRERGAPHRLAGRHAAGVLLRRRPGRRPAGLRPAAPGRARHPGLRPRRRRGHRAGVEPGGRAGDPGPDRVHRHRTGRAPAAVDRRAHRRAAAGGPAGTVAHARGKLAARRERPALPQSGPDVQLRGRLGPRLPGEGALGGRTGGGAQRGPRGRTGHLARPAPGRRRGGRTRLGGRPARGDPAGRPAGRLRPP